MSDHPFFIIGKRYRNRNGGYEVLDIDSTGMHIRYDDGTEQTITNLDLQQRIVQNVRIDTQQHLPYPKDQDVLNHRYIFTLGFLAGRGRFEAIVPPKSRTGFEQSYRALKGEAPQPGQDMYYLHKERDVDKWGSELRITFATSQSELDRLAFGPNVVTVRSPNGERRINNNGLIWRLWEIGFQLGAVQQPHTIRANLPSAFLPDFDAGLAFALNNE